MEYLWILFLVLWVLERRVSIITAYKMAYYRQKLINRKVDISAVENVKLRDILK